MCSCALPHTIFNFNRRPITESHLAIPPRLVIAAGNGHFQMLLSMLIELRHLHNYNTEPMCDHYEAAVDFTDSGVILMNRQTERSTAAPPTASETTLYY